MAATQLGATYYQKRGKNNNKDPGQDGQDDRLDGLQHVASFECKSGVLFWGQLEYILEAKAKLKDKGQIVGNVTESGAEDGTTFDMAMHESKCQAMKGRWSKYYFKVYFFHPYFYFATLYLRTVTQDCLPTTVWPNYSLASIAMN